MSNITIIKADKAREIFYYLTEKEKLTPYESFATIFCLLDFIAEFFLASKKNEDLENPGLFEKYIEIAKKIREEYNLLWKEEKEE